MKKIKKLGRPFGSKNKPKSKAMVAAAPVKRAYRKRIDVDALRAAANKLTKLKGVSSEGVADAAIADVRTTLRVTHAAYAALNFRDVVTVLDNEVTQKLLVKQFMMCLPRGVHNAAAVREHCRTLAAVVLTPLYDRMLSTPETLPDDCSMRDVTDTLQQLRALIIASRS